MGYFGFPWSCIFLFYILLDIRLSSTFLWTFVFCSLLYFSQSDVVNIAGITGHVHRSIVDKIDSTSADVEMVKHILSITLCYIFLWNVIRRIYLPYLQLISKIYDWWTATTTFPTPLSSKVKEWLMMNSWWKIVH